MHAGTVGLPSVQRGLSLPGEQIPQSVVVVLIKSGVYERIKEGVGVTQPQKNALPDGRNVTGAQRDDELGDEERNPAKDKHANQNAHHQCCLFLLLLSPCVPVCLEGYGGVPHSKHHLGPCLLLYLITQIIHQPLH